MAIPKVWSRFERTLKDGTVKKFRVQEVPSEMYEDICKFMISNFIPEAPFIYAAEMRENPAELDKIKRFWKEVILPKNLSVVCLEDKYASGYNDDIIGVNFLLPYTKNDKTENEEDFLPKKLALILNEVNSRFDIFDTFKVDEFLGAAGLAVNKKYRGMNIGAEILLARTFICKERGFQVTETIFTAVGSQVLAKKAGFSTLMDIEFADIAEKTNVTFPTGFKTLKVMTKIFE